MFHFDPPFPPLQTLALILLAVGVTLALLRRGPRRQWAPGYRLPLVLRGVFAALLVFILLNPIVTASVSRSRGKRPLIILLDTSRSMNTVDVSDPNETGKDMPRWTMATRATLENRSLLNALSQHYDVQFYGFASHATRRSPDDLMRLAKPNGDSTDIGDSIAQTVNGNASPTDTETSALRGAVLVVSDGRDNRSNPLDAARAAKALGFPVYTVCVGHETREQDIQVAAKRPQAFSAPGQTVAMTAEITDLGFPSASVRVDLLKEGKRIASKTVTLHPGTEEVSFPAREAKKGFYRYALACTVVPGEVNEANNRANVFLNVMDTRARVLLMEGQPSWDSKFLAETLRDDPTITLDSIFKLTPNKPFALSGSPGVSSLQIPRTVEDFAHYDVVILGKGYEEFFDAASTEALKKWVSDKGGDLVFLRGRADERTPALHDLEPVQFGDQQIEAARLRLTEAGRSYPGFALDAKEDAQTIVEKLPSLISATQVQGEKALSVVLARAQGSDRIGDAGETQAMALLAYERYGQGKTMAVVGQGLWRWAFLPPEMAAYSHVYSEFWTQTIRWLVSESDFLPGMNIALRADRTSYSLKDTVNFQGYLRGVKAPSAPPVITVTLPNGKTTKVVSATGAKAADFTASYRPTLPGEYMASVPPPAGGAKTAPATAAFTVYPGQEEDANRSADPLLMEQIAAVSGGQALKLDELPNLPEKLRAADQAASRAEEPRTAWDRAWFLALLLALLAAEWLTRRRLGLA